MARLYYAPAVYGKQDVFCVQSWHAAEGNGAPCSYLHGYPGHEKNLDLAQSLRRTGFSSVIFFYRGCWK